MLARRIVINILILIIAKCHIYGQNTPKIGLVLSGGGAKGLAHIGVLKVLEEYGIPIDYIGGTSMGSIVGGLYAIGYNSKHIEQIAATLDWDLAMTDNISRKKLSMTEKEMDGRYFIALPIRNKKIKLPGGFVTGQNIAKIFSRLTWPVHTVNDFSYFDIPFICVATDIEKGESVTLKSGFLGDAMRASMSIPSLFSPVEIDGKLYVDGGLLNNLPVVEVKNMGADIIIAVDVQDPFYTKDEINSFMKVMEQSSKILRRPANEKAHEMAEIIIKPKFIASYSITDFEKCDTLIALGEQAARKMLPQIEKLIGERRIDYTKRKSLTIKSDSLLVNISKIEIQGLNHVSKQLVLGKLKIELPGRVTVNRIEDGIDRIYGSRFFEKVSYRIEPTNEGQILVISVKENNNDFFKVGIHYDDDFKSAILLNAAFRNLYKNGSLLNLDLKLSENPEFRLSYFVDKGWKPGFHGRFTMGAYEFDSYENNQRVARLTYSEMTLDLGFQSTIAGSYAFRVGAAAELASLRSNISPIELDNIDYRFINYYARFDADTYDRAVYPTKGMQLTTEAKVISDYNNYSDISTLSAATLLKFSHKSVLSLHRKFAITTRLTVGIANGDSIPLPYYYYLGGLGQNYVKGILPFVGLNMMEESGQNTWLIRLGFRYEAFKDLFFTAKFNAAKVTMATNDLFKYNNIIKGYGLTTGYNTLIGPIELTIMRSNSNHTFHAYLNIGFWF